MGKETKGKETNQRSVVIIQERNEDILCKGSSRRNPHTKFTNIVLFNSMTLSCMYYYTSRVNKIIGSERLNKLCKAS